MLHYDIECPNCHSRIDIPFMKELEAKSIEDYDIAEKDAQTKVLWFRGASWWQLLRFWWRENHPI